MEEKEGMGIVAWVIVGLMAAVITGLIAVHYGWDPWPYGLAEKVGYE
jgi:uncharacterized membrane protein YeaQ/YmgE (transglycosylase-associated protein family)